MGSLYYNMDQLSKSAKKLLGRLILSGTVQQWEKITEVQKIKIDLEEDLTDITHWIFQNIYSKNLSYLGRFNTDELTESNLSVLAVIIETQLIRNIRKDISITTDLIFSSGIETILVIFLFSISLPITKCPS